MIKSFSTFIHRVPEREILRGGPPVETVENVENVEKLGRLKALSRSVIRLRERGLSVAAIASRLDVSPDLVIEHLYADFEAGGWQR